MKATIEEIRSKAKYLKPPPIDEMIGFIESIGISYYHFEYYYGMPYGMIKVVKNGYRQLPAKYWYIFYEKIIPQYGVGFKNEVTSNVSKSVNYVVNKTKAKQRKTPSKDNRLVVIE